MAGLAQFDVIFRSQSVLVSNRFDISRTTVEIVKFRGLLHRPYLPSKFDELA